MDSRAWNPGAGKPGPEFRTWIPGEEPWDRGEKIIKEMSQIGYLTHFFFVTLHNYKLYV